MRLICIILAITSCFFFFKSRLLAFSSCDSLAPLPKVKEVMFPPPFCLFVCLCAGYLKKLWTDSDEILWTGSLCDEDELIRFWWRSGSDNDDFLKSNSSLLRDWSKNDISHDIWKMYWVQYVLVDQAVHGGGMRSTECPSSLVIFFVTIDTIIRFFSCPSVFLEQSFPQIGWTVALTPPTIVTK